MPIAFPPSDRGPDWDWASRLQEPDLYQCAPNLAAVGEEFMADHLSPGLPGDAPLINRAVNLCNPGVDYEMPEFMVGAQPCLVLVPAPAADARFSVLQFNNSSNLFLIGISRSSTGAVLGNCQVMVFRTEDRSLVAETTSDGSGNWSVSLMKGGPFFLVEYKAGVPDVAGTSVNTLVPS